MPTETPELLQHGEGDASVGIGENIRTLREWKGLSQAELAATLGYSNRSVSDWETGKTKPRFGAVRELAEFFGVSTSFLWSDAHIEIVDLPGGAKPIVTTSTAPLYASVSAGMPQDAIEIEGEVPVPDYILADHPGAYFLRVSGQSMNRVLADGEYALIDDHAEVHNGDAAVVLVNGCEHTIKRVYRTASNLILSPDSTDPAFGDEIFELESGVPVEIRGRVIWSVKPYTGRV